MRHVYDHGLPFSEKLAENLVDLRRRVIENNKATLIIVDGGVGEGKTTLCVHIADYLQGSPIDFKKQLAMGGEQLMRRIETCYAEQLPVIIYDEAGDFNRRGALTKFNQLLNRVFETYRAFKIIVIVALPNFNVLDNQLFDNKIPRLLLHLRGRNNSQGNFSAYSLWRMMYVKHKMNDRKFVVKEAAFDRTDPNFRGHFLDLPPERSKKLSEVSTAGKIDFLIKGTAKLEGLLTYEEISRKVGRSTNWARQSINRLKIKPVRIVKKVRYYQDDVVELLKNERVHK